MEYYCILMLLKRRNYYKYKNLRYLLLVSRRAISDLMKVDINIYIYIYI